MLIRCPRERFVTRLSGRDRVSCPEHSFLLPRIKAQAAVPSPVQVRPTFATSLFVFSGDELWRWPHSSIPIFFFRSLQVFGLGYAPRRSEIGDVEAWRVIRGREFDRMLPRAPEKNRVLSPLWRRQRDEPAANA